MILFKEGDFVTCIKGMATQYNENEEYRVLRDEEKGAIMIDSEAGHPIVARADHFRRSLIIRPTSTYQQALKETQEVLDRLIKATEAGKTTVKQRVVLLNAKFILNHYKANL